MGREDVGLLVLNDAGGISRNALAFPTLPVHTQLVEIAVMHGTLRKLDFPVAVIQAFQPIGGALTPIVELAHQINFGRIGRPFTEHPTAFNTVKAIIIIGVSKIIKITRAASEFGDFVHCVLMTTVDSIAIGL